MKTTADNNQPVTYEMILVASRDLQYTDYTNLLTEVRDMPTSMEGMFRLCKFVDTTPEGNRRDTVTQLLQDIEDGSVSI